MRSSLLLLLLSACGVDGETPSTPTTDDAPASSDDSADDTPAPRSDAPILHHVISSAEIAPQGEGFDLDGDGELENALGPLAGVVTPTLNDAIASSEYVGILQMSGLDGADADVLLGYITAIDSDGDVSDNFTGSESFPAGDEIDADGIAILQADTDFAGDSYTAAVPAGSYLIGGISVTTATDIFVEGQVSDLGHKARLSYGVTLEALQSMLEESEMGEMFDLLKGLADLDLDLDGEADALSFVVDVKAVPCEVTP